MVTLYKKILGQKDVLLKEKAANCAESEWGRVFSIACSACPVDMNNFSHQLMLEH